MKSAVSIAPLLRHTDLFLAAVRKNPSITLAEIAQLEKEAGLE